jgi:hypothetical protein
MDLKLNLEPLVESQVLSSFLEAKNISVRNEEFEKIVDKIQYEGKIRKAVLEESEILRIIYEIIG